MCTRYKTPDQAAIERAWHIGRDTPALWTADVFPRASGPFLRRYEGDGLELAVGTWGLIPHWSKTPRLAYSTNNARSEELAQKPTFRDAWKLGQRCIIPATSFDEPCWETGKNIWWRFWRADGAPWGLAGLWNRWVDRATGEVVESYTMLTVNADAHPLMSRMHKPDPKLPAEAQDKRSVVAIEANDVEQWMRGSLDDAKALLQPPPIELIEAKPA